MTANSRPICVRLAIIFSLIAISCMSGGGCSDPITDHEGYAALVEDMGGKLYAHLDFKGTSITDSDLQNLTFPDTIYSVSMSYTGITDEGGTELERSNNLERLDLTNTKITDETLKFLEGLTNLRVAHVMNLQVSRDQFQQLRSVLSQKSDGSVPPLMAENFPRVPEVEPEPIFEDDPFAEEKKPPPTLLSDYAREIRSLDGDLQIHLELSNAATSDEDLKNLPFTDSVRSISLRNTNVSDAGLTELARARNLHSLDLHGTQITDAAAQILTTFPRLSELDISSTQLTQKKQQMLRRFIAHRAAIIPVDQSREPKTQGGQPSRERPSTIRSN